MHLIRVLAVVMTSTPFLTTDLFAQHTVAVRVESRGLTETEVAEHLKTLGMEVASIPWAAPGEGRPKPRDAGGTVTLTLGHGTTSGPSDLTTPWGVRIRRDRQGWERTEFLGKSMTVTAVDSPQGVVITDSAGGRRLEEYRGFRVREPGFRRPGAPVMDRSHDDVGLIVEFLRDEAGQVIGAIYGEVLAILWHQAPGDEDGFKPASFEAIDLRSGHRILDSRSFPHEPFSDERAMFRIREDHSSYDLVRVEHSETFVLVYSRNRLHALLPVGHSSMWRSVLARGDYFSLMYGHRVDYTDERLRVHVFHPEGKHGRGAMIIETPRQAGSTEPIRLLLPTTLEGELPSMDTADRSGRVDEARRSTATARERFSNVPRFQQPQRRASTAEVDPEFWDGPPPIQEPDVPECPEIPDGQPLPPNCEDEEPTDPDDPGTPPIQQPPAEDPQDSPETTQIASRGTSTRSCVRTARRGDLRSRHAVGVPGDLSGSRNQGRPAWG